MTKHISQRGVSLISKFEGCRLTAYKCPAGVWTIGYGHTKGVTSGQTITLAEAEEFLRNDLTTYENHVTIIEKMYGYKFNQNQFDALVSFTYNCGAGNLKNLVQSGKRTIEQISAKIPAYNKAGGVVLKGLQKRRAEEKALFDEPVSMEYYPMYTGKSTKIDDVLSSIGANGDYDNTQTKAYLKRLPIAQNNGISDYRGTSAQNMKIVNLAKTGKLRR